LLWAAASSNGLVPPTLKPWHIKISFEAKGVSGHSSLQGSFEEFWAGPDKYKRVFATGDFNQVEYTTPGGVRRTGSRDGAPAELTRIVDQFLHPIPLDQDTIVAANLQIGMSSLGQAKLVCVKIYRPASAIEPNSDETYCMDEHSPVLRLELSGTGSSRIIRNSIVRFEGGYLPQTIEEYGSSNAAEMPVLTAKLEKIEALGSVDETMFTPPADAVSPPRVITLSERETKPQRLHHPFPEYDQMSPGVPRSVHMAGLVMLALRVQTDGHVTNVRAVGGMRVLQQGSVEAVRKWTYKPFTRDGEPVEVDTTVTLVYSLTE
jgi:hypothetical protein